MRGYKMSAKLPRERRTPASPDMKVRTRRDALLACFAPVGDEAAIVVVVEALTLNKQTTSSQHTSTSHMAAVNLA
jgi:hypothetical protein